MPVGRPKKNPKEMLVEVPCKVPTEVADEIAKLSTQTDRSRSQIARKLIVRGLAAYVRDGSLEEVAIVASDSDEVKNDPEKNNKIKPRRAGAG